MKVTIRFAPYYYPRSRIYASVQQGDGSVRELDPDLVMSEMPIEFLSNRIK